jgi:hypothetical protein
MPVGMTARLRGDLPPRTGLPSSSINKNDCGLLCTPTPQLSINYTARGHG